MISSDKHREESFQDARALAKFRSRQLLSTKRLVALFRGVRTRAHVECFLTMFADKHVSYKGWDSFNREHDSYASHTALFIKQDQGLKSQNFENFQIGLKPAILQLHHYICVAKFQACSCNITCTNLKFFTNLA